MYYFNFSVPSAPNELILSSVTSSTVSLRWNHKAEGTVKRTYKITWKSPIKNGTKEGIAKMFTTITGLISNTVYSFSIIAVSSGGASKPSKPLKVVTGMSVFPKIYGNKKVLLLRCFVFMNKSTSLGSDSFLFCV